MKKASQQSPIWPYLGILAFLFVLSLTAPRAWNRREVGRVAPRQNRTIQYPADLDAILESHDVVSDVPPEPDVIEIELSPEPQPPMEPERSTSEVSLPVGPLVPPAPEFADQVRDDFDGGDANAIDRPDEPESEPELPHESPPEADDEAALATTAWPLPRALLEQLSALSQQNPHLAWPERAIELVHEVCQDDSDPAATRARLQSLRDLATADASSQVVDGPTRAQINRSRYALARWLDVWDASVTLGQAPLAPVDFETSAERIGICLADFDAMAGDEPAGAAWRDYLKLDMLAEATLPGQSEELRRTLARAVLGRLASRRLSPAQREFVDEGPLADLKQELRAWAAEPVPTLRLLDHLEHYEHTLLASDAQLVADDYRGLNWSAPDAANRLSRRLNIHYRNANVRVAVTGALINRLVPQPDRIDAPVRDRVVNVPVRGRSSTFTELSVKLVPDPRRIRLGLEARGIVDANTITTSGPATFRNNGQSTFLVRKLFLLGPQGLTLFPAISEAENNFNYLVSLETNFDGVPLVGSLVRTIARNQHDEVRGEARRQTAAKVAIRALHQLDSEARERVTEAANDIEDNQLATLRRLGLELTPISLSTSEQRVVARARLAGPQQLGAHTPRPRAPSDSWFSLQLHQSALNNGLEQLDLDGRTFELPELFVWVAQQLGRPELAELDDLPDDVQLTFAEKDSVRLKCEDGRVKVTFALAALRHEGSRWRNFEVYTYYAPEAQGLSPCFVRDDTIHLSLRGKLALKLRAIFSRVLSKNRDLRLLGESITSNPDLQDLQITQFVVEDGWIGLAYSPRRDASHVARQGEERH